MRFLLLIPSVVCLFLGVGFLLVFRYSRIKQETRERCFTGQAWARLAETGSTTQRDADDRVHTVFFGIYEYETADGQQISSASEFRYGSERGIPGMDGKMVQIRYDPRNPTDFALQEEEAVALSVWPKFRKIGIGFTILGVLFMLAAVAVMLGFFDLSGFSLTE